MRIMLQNSLGRAWFGALILGILLVTLTSTSAQVTTSSMVGQIVNENGEPLVGAVILATHVPSGSRYGSATNEEGRYTIPGMRVGGPYEVAISYIGFENQKIENIFLSLGTAATVDVNLAESAIEIEAVTVTRSRNDLFSSNRTGAATNITEQQLNALPTINRNFLDFANITPQASGTSFAGQDGRLNNITIDGSLLNNSFGLSGRPGGRTGIAPISLDAIQEVQVNIAPYDVRQSGFVGAGINAITRSGSNEVKASAFYTFRNESLTGNMAGDAEIDRDQSPFNTTQYGFRLGGPIIKNKLFFFVNAEFERRSNPYLERANSGNDPVEGNVTRVLESDLVAVSNFLQENYGYETGPYQGYDQETVGDKFLAKLDWNINDNNKLSVRFSRLDSEDDVLISNSSALGFGSRRQNGRAMSYRNSNYIIFDKITSVVGELNTLFSNKVHNNLIVGYTYQNEDRAVPGGSQELFPLIEIQSEGTTYISAGYEPFTPFNQLEYTTYQLQDNLSIYANKHTITAGLSLERLEFRNVFFFGAQGNFVYETLDDFYTDLADGVANPNRTTSPVELRRFVYRYSALPGGAEPVQPTEVTYGGIYLQDQFAVNNQLTITGGIRVDVPWFGETGFENAEVSTLTFFTPDGRAIQQNTAKLPDPNPLWSPRLGFNWDVKGDKTLQVRGGTGVFTGRPAFVWISNQIGNNGVLIGEERIDNTFDRPFTPDPGRYITNPEAPSSYNLATTDEDFKFPQVWRSNFAIDAKLPWGLEGTLELLYNQDVNGISYQNINLEGPNGRHEGPDNRPTFPGLDLSGGARNSALRINDQVTENIYLTNQNEGRSFVVTASVEKKFSNGFFAKAAYNYGRSQNLVDPGSIAGSSFNGITSVNGNNFPDLAFSRNDQRHRVLGVATYRKEYGGFGSTQIGFFLNGGTQDRFSYVYNQDQNGDGRSGNDLIYVPNNASELTFEEFTRNGITFTPAQQAAAFDAFIDQDDYLSERRGQYAERNGGLEPWLWRANLSVVQEFFINVGGKRNSLELRMDILNFTNLINSDWGVSDRVINTRPLDYRGQNEIGVPVYRMVTTGSGTSTKLLDETFRKNASFGNDTYSIQFGVRYTFN